MSRLATRTPAADTLTPGALAEFQAGFAQALVSNAKPALPAIAALTTQPAFAVYRNTVMKACIDTLQANYPAVNRLVGDEWFRAAAAVYARENLPKQPMLLQYGAGYADFLAGFDPAAELPYLPDVARLDRCWIEAHISPDEAPLDGATVATLASGNFFRTRLKLHAAARWHWFDQAPVYTIWSRNRTDEPIDTEIEWQAEGALLTRPRDVVQWVAMDQAGCAFLDACAAGATLAGAAEAALDIDGNADLAALMSALLDAGAFSGMSLHNKNHKEE